MGGLRALRKLGVRLGADENGAAAIEFGLVAPILSLGLLAVVDLGFAEYERMTMDHTLRAAAQFAMSDPPTGQTAVCQRLQAIASKHYGANVSASCNNSAADLKVSVSRFCACPAAPSTSVACSTTCGGGAATYIYYRLEGSRTVPFNILPNSVGNLTTSVQVQVR